jgi:hypothetical protein
VVGTLGAPDYRYADVDIRYTKGAVNTVLFRQMMYFTGGADVAHILPQSFTFKSGLAVPAGATLKIGSPDLINGTHSMSCTVAGFEIPVE